VKPNRWIPYGILLLGVVGFFGWLSREQARADEVLNSELYYAFPPAEQLPPDLAGEPEQRLAQFAELFTRRYRQVDVPLRVRVLKDKEGKPYLRLGVAIIVPRWYVARTARTLWNEARTVMDEEVPIQIHETYIFGQSRWIGECVRVPQSSEILVRLVR